jgi:hypothetical protein
MTDLTAGQLATIERLAIGIYVFSFAGSLFVVISWIKVNRLQVKSA